MGNALFDNRVNFAVAAALRETDRLKFSPAIGATMSLTWLKWTRAAGPLESAS
jgi:hypothetical protein